MKNDKLILAHWDMVDCLMTEVVELPLAEGLHGHELMEELFHQFASRDKRFHARGFRWNQQGGYMQYTPPYREQDDPRSDWAVNTEGSYYGEAAIAAFLGMKVTGSGRKMQASAEALRFIYKHFPDKIAAREWLRWHVQKLHGYTCKTRDMDKGRPRAWPIIEGTDVVHWTEIERRKESRNKFNIDS